MLYIGLYSEKHNLTLDCGVSCHRASGILTIADLQRMKCCCHSSAFIFELIIFIFEGNKDIHKSLDEFEFRSDPTTYYGVSCPLGSEYSFPTFSAILIQIFLILVDYLKTWYNILCLNLGLMAVSSSELQPLSIIKYGVSTYYAGSQVSDSCPLGYLF